MRKLFAFFFICLLAFNWYGYRLVLYFLAEKGNLTLQQKLDKEQYDPTDLVELRLPLNLPYISDWADYENFDGETIIDGLHYRYVKRKLYKGELILLCVPDQNSNKLQKAGNEYFKQVNDIPQSEKKSKQTVKASTGEYTCNDFGEGSLAVAIHSELKSDYQQLYSSIKLPTPAQPPNC